MKKAADKIAQLRSKVGVLVKDTHVKYKSVNYRYFDINTLIEKIEPALTELNLTIIQPLKVVDGTQTLVTHVIDLDTGEIILDSVAIIPSYTDPQKTGAAITYMRRYSLQSMLFLQAEDDDANEAFGRNNSGTPIANKTCNVCGKSHTGQYPTCYNCYTKKKNQR